VSKDGRKLIRETHLSDEVKCGRVARTLSGGDDLGGPHVGFTCGAFDLVVPSFYPLTRSIGTSPASPLA
jgi:hypothetical protein